MKLNYQKLFNHNETLFIGGETGVGKTTKARELSERYKAGSLFLSVNLASLGESLFEGQLFGHKKGAFTGADKDHLGFFEQVGSGVLFLDEIGELSLNLQKKLLSVLEEKTFYPLGSSTPRKFRGMVIVATHQDLKLLVEKGLFRKDLYYRISRFVVNMPSLKSQRSLLRLMLEKYENRFSFEVFNYLCEGYDWPGNFRELKNLFQVLEFSEGEKVVDLSELSIYKSMAEVKDDNSNIVTLKSLNYAQALSEFERKFFLSVMEETDGRVNYTADQLGISKTTLIAKLKKYGISSLQIRAMSHAA